MPLKNKWSPSECNVYSTYMESSTAAMTNKEFSFISGFLILVEKIDKRVQTKFDQRWIQKWTKTKISSVSGKQCM